MHIEPALLARFPDGCRSQWFAAVHVATGEHPLAIARLDGPPHQHDAARSRADDRPDRDFGIDVEDEAAGRADEPLAIAGFEEARLERAATPRAEAVGMRLVVRMHRLSIIRR